MLFACFLYAGAAFAVAPERSPDAPPIPPDPLADSSAPAAAVAPAEAGPEAVPEAVPTLTAEEIAAFEAAMAAEASVVPPSPPASTLLQSLNPDIAFIGDVAFAYFSADEPMTAGEHDPSANGFTLQQLELSINKSVDPYFKFDASIVFSLFGVEVEEVYATTLALPGRFQVRAGQFLTRFGRVNRMHPHAWDFVDQNIAIGRVFGGDANRALGVEVSWLAPTPWYIEVVGSGTGAAGEGTARSFYGADDLGFETPLDLQNLLAVKQFFPFGPNLSLAWGLSGAFGPNSNGLGTRSEVYGTDVYLKYRPITTESSFVLSLQTEWLYRRREVPDDILDDHTGYAQVFCRFAPRWGAAARYEIGTPALTATGVVAADPLDPDWTENRQRTALSLTFWPTEFSRIRLEGESDVPGWKDEPELAALLAFEFNVGAHGAHSF